MSDRNSPDVQHAKDAQAALDAAQQEEADYADRLRIEAEVEAQFAKEEAEAAVEEAKAALAEAEQDLKDAETEIQKAWFELEVERRAADLAAAQRLADATVIAAPQGEGTPTSPIAAETPAAVEHAGGRVDTEPTADPRKGHMESSVGPHVRRFLFYVLIVALAGFVANWWWQDRIESEQKQIESTRHEQQAAEARQKAFLKLINEMASEVNAVTNWATNLAGGDISTSSPVFAAELQKQWIINRPILFLGKLRDFAINQDGSYVILVEYNARPRFRRNSILVSLTCSEAAVTNLTQAAKTNRTMRRVAITGTIQRVESATGNNSEGRPITVLTGFGTCLSAALLTGMDNPLFNNAK